MHPAIAELLHYSGGLIGRRDHPELATRLDHAVRRGELTAVLPGVYCLPDLADDWRTRAAAVALWDARAVLVGEAAAALTFWPALQPTVVEVAARRTSLTRAGFTFTRRSLPPSLVVQRAAGAIADPALTALDLVPRHGADAIDHALRSRMTTLAAVREALRRTLNRRGNADRRLAVLDSRGNPWSAAERLAHRLLRSAGITRWHANVPIVCRGETYYQDIAMDDCPVTVEIDGREFHLRPAAFESDRRRGNHLLLAGKHVLHYTWRMLDEEPAWFTATAQEAIDRYS